MHGLINPISLTHAGAKLPGMTRLFIDPSLPQGMLFKEIPDIYAALDVGGLILVAPSGDYVFYVGDTLKDVLIANMLGKFVSDSSAYSTVSVGGSAMPIAFQRKDEHTRRSAYIYGDGEYSNSILHPGGIVTRTVCYMDYFADLATSTTLQAYGIVTSANRGHGVRKNKTLTVNGSGYPSQSTTAVGAWGYIACDTAMNTTFGKFLQDVKDPALVAVPDDLKGYYLDTFDMSVAASDPGSKPTISTGCYWRDNVLGGGSRNGNYMARMGNPYGAIYRNPVNTTWDTELAGTAGGPSPNLGNGYRNVSTVVPPPVSSPLYIQGGVMEWENPLGKHKSETPLLPMMCELSFVASDDRYDLCEGEVGKYKPGVLIDAMLLGRSMVQNIKAADSVSNFSDLAAMVNGTFNNLAEDEFNPSPGANLTTEVGANAAFSRLNAARSRISRNVFHCGTLPSALERFNSVWDNNAKNAAQA